MTVLVAPAPVSKGRLETLVDGIFAIAMTILVLEVRLPELEDPRSVPLLGGYLVRQLPTIGAYFFSFFVLGSFWLWHHRIFHRIIRVDRVLAWLTMAMLSFVAFFPFAAGLFGRFTRNPAYLAVYFPVLLGMVWCQVATHALAWRRGLLDPAVPVDEIRRAHLRNVRSLFGVTLGASFALVRLGTPGMIGAAALIAVPVILMIRAKRAG